MNEDQKKAWGRIVAKVSDFIRLSLPPSAQGAVKDEVQRDVTIVERFITTKVSSDKGSEVTKEE